MAQATPKRRLWLWLAGAFGMVFILGLCIAGGVIALGLLAILPMAMDSGMAKGHHPISQKGDGANSYENVEEMARNFEDVYLTTSDLGNTFARSRSLATGISNGGKDATIYCQHKGKLEKLTNESIAAMIHEVGGVDLNGNPIPPPTIRLSYNLKENRISGDVGFKSNMHGLERARELHGYFSYILTDESKYKREGTKERKQCRAESTATSGRKTARWGR
jgi:hypothetical protein